MNRGLGYALVRALLSIACVALVAVETMATEALTDRGVAQLTGEAPTAPRPVGRAHALIHAPQLDGDVLGDPAWHGIPATTGFTQVRPFAGRPVSQRTEIFIGFSDEALYLGIVCYDDDPAGIIVADSRRDSSLDDSDSFQVIIDTFRDGQSGFVFGTNPAGIEYDGQVASEGAGSGGFNLNWDTSWQVKAAISDIGWSAEMRIPFRSLRFTPGEAPVWGLNFQRNIRRNNEVAYWSPLPRQHTLYRLSAAGTLEGLVLPVQRNLQVVPYVLGRANRGGTLSGTQHDGELGVDVKYSLTSSLTLDLTYNTDFAQVEADDLQVDLNRFSVFFPEKRLFFLENSGQFTVGSAEEVELFFSRRIGITASGIAQPIAGGARLSGKAGDRTNLGLLRMRTDSVGEAAPGNDFTVARISRELPNRSSVGGIFVERQGDGSLSSDRRDDYNRSYALDGRWGIGNDGLVSGWAAKSETPGRRGRDHAYRVLASYNSQRWNNNIGYTEVAENFNPEVGFLRRRDYRKGEFMVFHRYRPDDMWGLHELRPHVAYRGYWGNDGFHESGFLHLDNHFEWRSGMEIHTGLNFVHEGVRSPFPIVRDVMVAAGDYDDWEAQLVLRTNQGAPLSLDLSSRIGGFFGGDRINLAPTVRHRVGETFTTELTWNHNDIRLPGPEGNFKINVGRLRVSYSFTPKMLLQALVQYDDRTDLVATNIRFSWLQSATAGLYLVYNEVDDETLRGPAEKRREITLKFSRIFEVL
jgi:hypothetical protein